MSKLEKLIRELCPNGVEYKKLIDLGRFYGGLTGKTKDDFKDGNKKFITYVNVFNNPSLRLDLEDKVKISDGENQRKLEYCDVIFTGSSEIPEECAISSVVVEQPKEDYYLNSFCFIWRINDVSKFNPHFLKHLFRSDGLRKQLNKTANGVTRFNVSKKEMENVEIPVPPREVQDEIVRILDNFTNLTAELTAELTARKTQYEFYKQSVFDDLKNYPLKHITDIALVKARVGWQRLTKAEYLTSGNHYLITGTDFKNGKIDFSSCVYVSKERYEMDQNIIVHEKDVLITKDGTLGKVAFLDVEPDKPTTLNSGVFRIKANQKMVTGRYLYHFFTSKYFTDFVESVKTGSTIPHLTQEGLVSLDIPVPPIEKQKEIVDLLDSFEAYTNDISKGLPAEIELRQKQYEYYRDKLLTFKRIGG